VSFVSDSFYAQWRMRRGLARALRDDEDSPPEKLLQTIWQHQRLRRDQLTIVDGRPLKILHPGFHNLEGGPDFRGAVVQIGDDSARTGDVELDMRASGWRSHGHDKNPAFKNVILHVVWEGDKPAANGPPLMVMRGTLDAPLGELSLWLGGEAAESLPAEWRGKCCAPLGTLTPERLQTLLLEAAEVRLSSKAAQFHARARHAGWEQSLWEGLFRALGYKHNVWPMQRLAELRPRWASAGMKEFALQSRLLGLSGLLPADLTRSQSGTDNHVRRVWDQWWRERDEFADCALPRTAWRLHGLRPANHPQRRLALAAGWASAGDVAARLERWCRAEIKDSALESSLLECLQVPADDFWSWHWTLRSARLPRAQPLLGATRVTDLGVNVVLPWLSARAREGRNESVRKRIEQRYFAWPSAEDNSLLRLARQRLLGGASKRVLKGAAGQQGLIQIVRDFCEHSNAICDNCKLPEMVRSFADVGAC
jgi:hypothetical protein